MQANGVTMDSVGDVRVSGAEPENTLCHGCVRVCVVDEGRRRRLVKKEKRGLVGGVEDVRAGWRQSGAKRDRDNLPNGLDAVR